MAESLGEHFWFGIAGAIGLVLALSAVMLWMARRALLRANEALRRTEAYLAEAQRLSHVGSWAFDVNTRQIVHASPEWFRIFDLDPVRAMPSVDAWLNRVHWEDRAKAAEDIESAVRGRRSFELDVRIVHSNGATGYVRAIGSPVCNES